MTSNIPIKAFQFLYGAIGRGNYSGWQVPDEVEFQFLYGAIGRSD